MNNIDTSDYILDTYYDMYNLPMGEFIYKLKKIGNEEDDVEVSTTKVLNDAANRGYNPQNIISFVESMVWDKNVCSLGTNTLVIRDYIHLKFKEFVKKNNKHDNPFADPILSNYYFLMICYRLANSVDEKDTKALLDKKNQNNIDNGIDTHNNQNNKSGCMSSVVLLGLVISLLTFTAYFII